MRELGTSVPADMSMTSHIASLMSSIDDPTVGLPEEIFLFASSIVPMVNVDLLIKDEEGRALLTWREDKYSEAGWHIPGGIIRYKEMLADRIAKVAAGELSAELTSEHELIAVFEFHIMDRRERADFITFLYQCTLSAPPHEALRYTGGEPQHGQWCWFEGVPEDLLSCHRVYEEYL